ncbi:iron-containing alcohol dehydrogenase [Alicyclobacillus cycloheptanicus]|uniref:Alcohol dehydrogenase class IV n=1 Tax=Alicyclobacillus cycloheptanicus TaxID=1457 RepID=A0ABT9XH06_9BACL|nr:iron-containing alcohol dehydrogenase [Alicyclobacillus cycloheptanicus]MDQ0189592.1 alcohol dehydrogenase class IV [Alicyclobacillus cycloheptanicus]WDL99903.1 iron-containing alcohol dehydrogenase [Alicyclobacillus cycloheptanicus]
MTTTYFQFGVRTAVHSGSGCRTLLPELLRGLGGHRALLVTDKGLTKAGVTAQVKQLFDGLVQPVRLVGVFDDVEQDAKGAIINKAVDRYKALSADCLIALGGGSVLDTVKAMKWMMHKGLQDVRMGLLTNTIEMFPEAQYIPIPHVALPTTAGTGAEVSPIAVVFNEMLNIKTNLINPFVAADFALLDPDLTVGLPPRITAFTGFDALTHALEAYFSPVANPMADAYAIQAARMIVDNLETVVHEGTNLQARANMLIASCMAISAFSVALNAIPVHNMAHAFGAKFNIPHGLANAVLLPYVMAAMPDFYLPRAHGFALVLGLKDAPADAAGALAAVVEYITELRRRVGLPDTFAEFNIQPSDLPQMVRLVQSDPSGILFKLPDVVIEQVSRQVAGTPVAVS